MPVRVEAPRFEHHREPIGIGEAAPRLSWRVSSTQAGWRQVAYEIEVAAPGDGDGGRAPAAPFTTGRIESAEQLFVAWPAEPLRSGERREVRVRVWSAAGDEPSAWSEPAIVEAGLLAPDDWQAQLVGPARDLGDRPDRPPVYFRREFELSGEIERARLYVTAHGVYAAAVNGQRAADHVLAPGWTSYKHRLRYQTYDVTSSLRAGRNAIGAVVAEGWYAGHLGFHGGRRRIWGEDVALLAQLVVRYKDGRTQTISTGDGWRCSSGPIVASGIYAGETYDARLEQPGWDRPGFDDTAWTPARTLGPEMARLVAPSGPPIRRTEVLPAVEILVSPSGRRIVDFGQDLVGRLRIRVQGPRGTTVTLRHAEVLEHGEVATRPLRGAAAIDHYTLRGDGDEEWEPEFTYHGFRYVEVDGWPGAISAASFSAVVMHTDMERIGRFETSDPLLNRFHENIRWTVRGNFMDVPTDCPQRDERLGWGGDLSVILPTASFIYDCFGMLRSWLADVAAEQREFGTVPMYVPWFPLSFPNVPVAVWGDAAVVVPWVLYERFGDVAVLRDQYESMKAWVGQVEQVTGRDHLWKTGLQLGDWLDPAAPPDAPERALTDPYLIATAYHALTAQLVADAARLLDREEDAARFDALAADVRRAFVAEFVSEHGRVVSDAATAYCLALQFGLLPDAARRERAADRLVHLIRLNDHKASTGFVGGRIVCDALTNAGAVETAYHLLLQRACPSWLFPVTMGATTVWERWDSMLPDGSLNPGDMLSFNHYALGAVGDWMHRTIAGLAPAAPGYRTLLVAPQPGGGLARAFAEHETPFGTASVRWERGGGRLHVTVVVPPGSSAIVRLPEPGAQEIEVGPGEHEFSCAFRDPEADPPRPAAPSALGLPPARDDGLFEA